MPTVEVSHLMGYLMPLGLIASACVTPGCATGKTTSYAQSEVRVAGIILKWNLGDRAANCDNAERLIRQAAHHGAKIVCTTESFLDGYSIRNPDLSMTRFRDLAEAVPGGKYISKLQRLADELDIHLIAAMSERDGEKVYNAAFLLGPDGKILGRYRKRFLGRDEKAKYTAGTSFPAFATPYGKIGMMICSDRRQPESMRQLVAAGADLVFCPAGGGYGSDSDRIVAQRSKEGRVPIVFVHPIEFLVTGRNGAVLTSERFGDSLDAQPSTTPPGVVRYYDLALSPNAPR